MKYIIGFILISLASLPAHAIRPGTYDYSILNECLWNEEVIDIEAECNDMFNHYLPAQAGTMSSTKDLRFGSYNIFRMSEMRNVKRLDYIAQMIDSEWDILALSEIQSNRAGDLSFNVNARVAFRDDIINADQLKKAYILPTYLLLLFELQKLDPSWGLIMSPHSQGSESDMFGFLYRSTTVQPIESKYCKENFIDNSPFPESFVYAEIEASNFGDKGITGILTQTQKNNGDQSQIVNERAYIEPTTAFACPLALEGLERGLFSKIPLTARFHSNNFDFSSISLHLRFREDKTCDQKCKNEALEYLLSQEGSEEEKQILRSSLIENGNAKEGPFQEVSRFFEVFATANAGKAIAKSEDDHDVIIAGDFNLEYKSTKGWQYLMWNLVTNPLANAVVLNTESTSLSEKYGYSKNYDHFILSNQKGFTDECDISTATRIDVLSEKVPFSLSNDFPIAEELASVDNGKGHQQFVQYLTNQLKQRTWVSKKGDVFDYDAVMNKELSTLPSEFITSGTICTPAGIRQENVRMNIIESAIHSLRCNVLYGGAWREYMSILSDHVPISMTCNAENSDQPMN